MNYKDVVYIQMLTRYIKEKRKSTIDSTNLFPPDWESINDDVLKTEILMQSLKNGISVKETPLYKEKVIKAKKNNII